MKTILLFLLLIGICGCYTFSSLEPHPVYRCSSNHGEAIVYLYGTTAILKVESQAPDGESTVPSYSVVVAHWAGEPDTIYSTGDIGAFF